MACWRYALWWAKSGSVPLGKDQALQVGQALSASLGVGCLPTLPSENYWPARWVTSWFLEDTLALGSRALEPCFRGPTVQPCQGHRPPSCLRTACSMHLMHFDCLEILHFVHLLKLPSRTGALCVYLHSRDPLGCLSSLSGQTCW